MSNDLATQDTPKDLRLLIEGRKLIAQARDIQDVKEIRDQAEAMGRYLRSRSESMAVINAATEIKLVAERNIGQRLQTTQLNGGRSMYHDDTSILPCLSDFGLSRLNSSRWQALATIPDDVFEEQIQAVKDKDDALTTAAFLRLAKALENAPAPTPQPYSLDDAISRLNRVARDIFSRWPEQHREVMAHQLRSLADELLEFGELCE